MNAPPERLTEFPLEPSGVPPAPVRETRPLYWSVRREVWENRSVYLAPLIVAAVVLFASWVNTMGVPRRMRAASDPVKRHLVAVKPISMAPAPIMFAALLVGLFYSLDALYGERRDRSIFFWKSLPVSDLTTVIAKASIPIAVLPLIALALSIATQILLLLLSVPIFAAKGMNPVTLWGEFRFFEGLLIMAYGLSVHALWFAPIYGWLMLVSAWARRAPFLWAVLPLLAVAAVERILFSTSYFIQMLGYRLTGAMTEAFVKQKRGVGGDFERLADLDPQRFLTAPGLWVGLAFAFAFFAAAVRLRRNREPI